MQDECSAGLAVALHEAEVYGDCLAFCKENSRCNYFTYDTSGRKCILFETCELNGQADSWLYSGHRSCSNPFRCELKGECAGKYVANTHEYDVEDCLRYCDSYPTCNYLVFNEDIERCLLLEDCQRFVDIDGALSYDRRCLKPQSGSSSAVEAISGMTEMPLGCRKIQVYSHNNFQIRKTFCPNNFN